MAIRVSLFLIVISIGSCKEKFEATYYPNGQVQSRRQVKNGIADGQFSTYFSNGRLESKGEWRNGEGNGYQEKYFESGVLKQTASYVDGKLNGEVSVYHDNGNIRLRAMFQEGIKIGGYTVYDTSGLSSEMQIFDTDGAMFYVVKWDRDRSKLFELVFPKFVFHQVGDSIEITAKSPFHFSGEAKVLIGVIGQPLTMDTVFSEFTLRDTVVVRTKISKFVDLKTLRYALEFTPSEHDTLSRFLYDRQLLQKPESNAVPPEISQL